MTSEVASSRRARIVPAIPRIYEKKSTFYSKQTEPASDRVISTTQDFGIEKYGKLPPPFYPATQRATPPSDVVPSIEPSEADLTKPTDDLSASPLPKDAGALPAEHIVDPAQSYQPATPVPAPSFPANPTPPADDMPESVPMQYASKMHHPTAPFQHQPTPPTDATPSPTYQAYQGYPYSTGVSFQPPQNTDYPDSSPTPSAYHGYAYTPIHAQYPTLNQLYTPASHSIPTELSLTDEKQSLIDDPEAEAPAPLSYSQDDGHYPASGVTLTKPPPGLIYPEAYSNPFPGHGLTSSSESESLGDPHHQTGFSGPSKSGHNQSRHSSRTTKSKSMPTVASAYEAWRETTIDDLRDVTLDPPFSTLSMSTFLLGHFDSPQFSDCLLHVRFKNNGHQPEELQLHRLVVAQSPVLAALLAASEADIHGIRHIHLEVQGSSITPAALRHALRTCYGRPAWEFIGLDSPASSSASQEMEVRSWIESALAFTAAGNALQLEDVVARGTQIAASIISWDNIETALRFAMEGVVDRVPENGPEEGKVEDSATDGAVSTSGAPKQSLPETEQSMMSLKPYIHGVAAYRLKQLCLRFLSSSFPTDWILNTSARPLNKLDRLPLKVESRPSSSNSRFSHIQFGSLPMPMPEDPNSLEYRLSSIVLSLPHSILAELFEQLNQMLSGEVIASIVSERERRRKVALRDASISYEHRLTSAEAWAPVGWQESTNAVEVDGVQQTTMTRTWTGFQAPLDQQ